MAGTEFMERYQTHQTRVWHHSIQSISMSRRPLHQPPLGTSYKMHILFKVLFSVLLFELCFWTRLVHVMLFLWQCYYWHVIASINVTSVICINHVCVSCLHFLCEMLMLIFCFPELFLMKALAAMASYDMPETIKQLGQSISHPWQWRYCRN